MTEEDIHKLGNYYKEQKDYDNMKKYYKRGLYIC